MDKENFFFVVIWCLAYNQARYISQCLDGFVMQQTTFPIHAIVHDDASTDGTAEIIRSYAEKYPDIIHPILESENQWSKKNGALESIMSKACKGAKYVAFCEGDDYWTDPLKLQKQVDFLETHADYSLCFHRVKVWNESEGVLVDDFITRDVPAKTDIIDLSKGNYIHTPSVVCRHIDKVDAIMSSIGWLNLADYPRWVMLSQFGPIAKLPEVMAVYRYGTGFWTKAADTNRCIDTIIMLAKIAPFIEDDRIRELFDEYMLRLRNEFLETAEHKEVELCQLRSSKAYRWGKIVLKPFSWIKRQISK